MISKNVEFINLRIKNIALNKMYNIDFKVSGRFVSIPVCLNDTLHSLIARMTDIEPFQKYSKDELETKLIKCLNKVTSNSNT